MNILTIIVLVAALLFAVQGFRKGFSGMVVNVLTMLTAAILTWLFASSVETALLEKTPLLDRLTENIEERIYSDDTEIEEETEPEEESEEVSEEVSDEETSPVDVLVDRITNVKLPGFLKKLLLQQMEAAQESAEKMIHAAAVKAAEFILKTFAHILLFVVVYILARIVFGLLGKIMKLPVLKQLDGLVGLLLGLLEALLLLEIFFVFAAAISDTIPGASLMTQITESPVLRFLYEKDVFLLVMKKLSSRQN